MFRLDKQRVKLSSVNPRAELHGDDTEPACDLKFKFTASNAVLDMFDERLRHTFFDAPRPDGLDVDLAEQGTDHDADYRPLLRFREIPTIPWAYQGAGYRLEVDQGFSGKENIYLIKTEIDKFKFVPKEGGSVEVEFRVIAHPNAEDFGSLCMLIQQEIDLTLVPPSPEERAQMEFDDAMGDEEQDEAA